jgi:hypothetical protein
MITIAKTDYYEIHFSKEKNRVYYRAWGFWPDVSVVPDYLAHVNEILKYIRPNFTMVVDMSEIEPHPPEVEELRQQAQINTIKAGMAIAAEIISKDFVSGLQFDSMTDVTKFPKNKFFSYENAEKWLDEYITNLENQKNT